jgi:hypothetical protein
MWAQALCRRAFWRRVLSGSDMARPYIIAHKLTMPRLWVGSDRLAEELCEVELKRRPGAPYAAETALQVGYGHISDNDNPKTETRRAKRRNGAAYQHRRLVPSLADTHVITHGRRMEYQRSHSMVLTIAGAASASWSDRAFKLLPRKRAGNAPSQRTQTAKQGRGRENRTRVTLHSATQTHVDPGRAPRRHPHLREIP